MSSLCGQLDNNNCHGRTQLIIVNADLNFVRDPDDVVRDHDLPLVQGRTVTSCRNITAHVLWGSITRLYCLGWLFLQTPLPWCWDVVEKSNCQKEYWKKKFQTVENNKFAYHQKITLSQDLLQKYQAFLQNFSRATRPNVKWSVPNTAY